MLHVGTQTWITTTSDPSKIGRQVSIYGVFFGIGFAVGPYLASTVQYGLANTIYYIYYTLSNRLAFTTSNKNAFPAQDEREAKSESSFSRYKQVVGLGWIALLGPLAYGVLEAMLNSNLPVYALRKGWSVSDVSFLLPAFAVGVLLHKFRSVY